VGAFPKEARGRFAFSPDGSTLAVVGSREVRLYDTDTRELRLTLPTATQDSEHEFCYGSGLAFSSDGSLLAVQDCDGVRVWTLDIDELLAIARTNVTRSLTSEECRLYLHVDPCP
jgi:WD40 repeat protein